MYFEKRPIPASVMTERMIIPAAPHPVNPTSSFPIRQSDTVTQTTKAKPKIKKMEGGKTRLKIVKDSIIIA